MSIQVRNLSHIYSKGMPDEQLALDSINFDIYDGEIVGIVGHTGSGKSTLLQHLNGLLKPSSGTIVVGNTEITAPGTAMKEIRQRLQSLNSPVVPSVRHTTAEPLTICRYLS